MPTPVLYDTEKKEHRFTDHSILKSPMNRSKSILLDLTIHSATIVVAIVVSRFPVVCRTLMHNESDYSRLASLADNPNLLERRGTSLVPPADVVFVVEIRKLEAFYLEKVPVKA